MDELDFLEAQLVQVTTRRDQAFTPLRIMLGSAFLSASIVILWFEAFRRHCLYADCEPTAMYGSELRTCGLDAVVCVLVGAGIGFGWHYLDNGGGRAVIAATPLAQHDAPSPLSSSPPPPQGGPVLNAPQLSGLSRCPQPAKHPRCSTGHGCGKHQPDRSVAASPQA
jgi:hypothetical protein